MVEEAFSPKDVFIVLSTEAEGNRSAALAPPQLSSLPTRRVLAGQTLPWKVRNCFLCWLGPHCGIPNLPLHWSQGIACSIPVPSQLNRKGGGEEGKKGGCISNSLSRTGLGMDELQSGLYGLLAALSLSRGSRLSLSFLVSG